MDYRADNPNPIPLFYQTGYLTISGFDREFRIYTLKFPNREVKYGFLNSLLPFVVGEKDAESPVSLRRMVKDLRCGELDSFMDRLTSLFAGIPYPEGTVFDYEREWRNQIFLVLALLGQHVKCEVHSSGGRADCIVETDGYIYIFEFQVDKSADEALSQIDQKGYAVPYQTDIRKIYKVGVSFSSLKRNISEWKAAEAH
ncbi:MAG: PD-(D/E)XK nuclease domain-containing protein [Lachnospiraceae bacterium]|nr:PD-(D/E)XK nuclease domain-containing protein [Lachnospiraceae bacterium]